MNAIYTHNILKQALVTHPVYIFFNQFPLPFVLIFHSPFSQKEKSIIINKAEKDVLVVDVNLLCSIIRTRLCPS